MSNVIKLLHEDHVHLLTILNALELQAKIAAGYDKPDTRYVRSVISYFRGGRCLAHYRREEHLLKMLERRAPHLSAKITVSLRYHRTLDDRLDDLEGCLRLFEDNPTIGRAAFVTAAIRFAEFEKAHFADEDEYLFPTALHILSPEELDYELEEAPWISSSTETQMSSPGVGSAATSASSRL